MVVGHFDGKSKIRNAQGPKSQAFHFKTRMCATCNGSRTQKSDREFDIFHNGVVEILNDGGELASIFDRSRYEKFSDEYLNIFRYFAKILACHIAEMGNFTSFYMVDFILGVSDFNPIRLAIDLDPSYATVVQLTGDHSYAAHGGLMITVNKYSKLPNSFRTTLTIGAVRYIFWVEFDEEIGMELAVDYPDFYEKCLISFESSISNPMTDDELRRHGFYPG